MRESEARLMQILDNSPIGVSIVSRKDRTRLFVNSRLVELFGGGTPDDLLALDVKSTFVKHDGYEQRWAEFDKHDVLVGVEDQHRRIDGSKWWDQTDWRCITFGGQEAVMVWHHDITNLKEAEQSLAAKEAIIRLSLDSMTDGIYVLDEHDNYVLFNEQYLKLMDLPDGIIEVGSSIERAFRAHAERGYLGPGSVDDLVAQKLIDLRDPGRVKVERIVDEGRLVRELRKAPIKGGGMVVVISDVTKRKMAEDAARDGQERLLNILDDSPYGVTIMSRKSREWLYANRRMSELNGSKAGQKRELPDILDSYVTRSDRDKCWAAFEEDNTINGIAIQRRRRDGTVWWSMTDWRPVAFGGIDAVMIWYVDISARKAAEDAVRESESRLHQVLDNCPLSVSIFGRTSNTRLYFNRQFKEQFGSGSVKSVGEKSYVDQADRRDNWAAFERDGAVHGVTQLRRHDDGSEWWCQADWRPLKYGGEDAIMVWQQDVSERKQAEEDIRHNSELVGLLQTTASDANKATNFDNALQTCLKSVCAFSGWPVGHVYLRSDKEENELISSGIWHLEEPDQFQTFREITERTTIKPGRAFATQVLATAKPVWIEDVSKHPLFSRAKATDKDIRVRAGFALPVTSKEKVVAVLEFFTDKVIPEDNDLMLTLIHIGTQLGRVFERKQAETALRQAMDETDLANRSLEQKVQERTVALNDAIKTAEAASLTKSEFLANMSHELRTPLNAIIGFSEIIKGAMFGPLGSQYQDYASDINSSGEHLLGIISDILDISKVEAGELALDEEQVDVAEAVAACEMMVRGRAEKAGVNLEFDIDPNLPLLSADPLRLKQILMNLLGNSIKFTPEDGIIAITGAINDESGLMLRVKDTGIGIAKGDLATVLEKFGQVRGGHTHAHEGAGLGLAIAKLLVERHGGSLDIDSELGKGTTVIVTFPPERISSPPDHRTAQA